MDDYRLHRFVPETSFEGSAGLSGVGMAAHFVDPLATLAKLRMLFS
jgi:hypothetical protein